MRTSLILAALLGIFTTVAHAAPASDAPQERVSALLSAYAKKDIPAVMSMVDPKAAMYGTAASEFFTTHAGIEGLLHSDYQQWTSATFGAPRNITTETAGDLQTVFFDAPFSATLPDGKQLTLTVRFATVWHKTGEKWLLVQSMNADLMR